MADVFLSYKREDQQIARDVAADMEAEGFSVFFDVRIEVGEAWDATIERELNAAKAAVVLWSAKSRESKWVRREAREAMARGILCPAKISHCKIPLEFSDLQTADLIDRPAGDRARVEWRRLCDGVGRCVGRKARGVETAKPIAPTKPETPKPLSLPHSERRETAAATRSRRALAIGGAAVLGAAALGSGYYGWTRVQADGVARAWEEARAAGARRAVYAFLRTHPHAPQVEEARAMLASLPLAVRETAVLRRHENVVWTATFSPDSACVLTASRDRTARLWDSASGGEIAELRGHEGGVNSAEFSPDGTRIVTTGGFPDNTARVWEATRDTSNDQREIIVLRGHSGNGLRGASFSPDGARIVASGSSENNFARVWESVSGREIFILRGVSAVFNPAGTQIATAEEFPGHTARIWDASSGREVALLERHDSGIKSVSFSPDGMRIVTASEDKTARVWDVASNTEILVLRGHQGVLSQARFSPDGSRIVTASSDGSARVWDAASGDQIVVLRGHDRWVRSASFSPDGTRILTASADARLWDAASGRGIATLSNHQGQIFSASFSPDGTRIVTAAEDHTARIWEIDEEA